MFFHVSIIDRIIDYVNYISTRNKDPKSGAKSDFGLRSIFCVGGSVRCVGYAGTRLIPVVIWHGGGESKKHDFRKEHLRQERKDRMNLSCFHRSRTGLLFLIIDDFTFGRTLQ
jgi:hypothetical protein